VPRAARIHEEGVEKGVATAGRRKSAAAAPAEGGSGTRSEWDTVLPDEDAVEPVSIVSLVRDPGGSGFDAAVEQEAAGRREALVAEFDNFLKGEPVLLGIFRCCRVGVTRPADVAARLGVDEKTVAAARKRLERRMVQFGRICTSNVKR
jgi:hypothetical protein